jgi:hypothetical protein
MGLGLLSAQHLRAPTKAAVTYSSVLTFYFTFFTFPFPLLSHIRNSVIPLGLIALDVNPLPGV